MSIDLGLLLALMLAGAAVAGGLVVWLAPKAWRAVKPVLHRVTR